MSLWLLGGRGGVVLSVVVICEHHCAILLSKMASGVEDVNMSIIYEDDLISNLM